MMRYSVFSVQDHYPAQSRTVSTLYSQIIEMAEEAERLGYDSFFVAEHHFHEYGVVPNPAVLLSTLAQRTKRIRLGSAISILTFHNPLTIAENYTMVDILSGGRLVFGVGSGYLKHEFEGYGIAPSEKRDRFDEAYDLIVKLMSGARVSHQGKFNVLDRVALNIVPIQSSLPIFVAILAKEAAYHLGRKGQRMMTIPYASMSGVEELAEVETSFRRGQADAKLPLKTDDAIYTFPTHIGETEGQVRDTVAPAFDRYVRSRLYARQTTYDEISKTGLVLFGTPDTVALQLFRLYSVGVRHVSLLHNFGLLPHDQVLNSIRAFREQVMPRFEALCRRETLQ